MQFLTATHTDIGIRKKTNQDSILVMQADTDAGQVLLASICDGMGGLAKGEVASAAMVYALRDWFEDRLPVLLQEGFRREALWRDWRDLAVSTGNRIGDYGRNLHVELGTTCVAILFVGTEYFIMNVGDSRIYWLTDNIYQLTKDQTYVQREYDMGRMTFEQTLTDPQRSVLLQCIGAGAGLEPAFHYGTSAPGQVFMLCCDGFRHVIDPREFYQKLQPGALKDARGMKRQLVDLTQLNLQRGETDNISAILVRTK